MAKAGMTPTMLQDRLRQGERLMVLDVRSKAEFAAGHIPGAVNVPYTTLLAGSGDVRAKKSEMLVVYCGHGPRAWMAGQALRLRGFKKIAYLRGHMAAWRRSGLPEERSRA